MKTKAAIFTAGYSNRFMEPVYSISICVNPDYSFIEGYGEGGKLALLIDEKASHGQCMDLQSDGNLLIGGSVLNDDGSTYFVARLQTSELTSLIQLEAAAETAWKIYPNPASDYIELGLSAEQLLGYRLLDMQGRTLICNPAPHALCIEIRQLAAGSYVLQVQRAEGVSSKLFVKEISRGSF